jgi:hypothetical protein
MEASATPDDPPNLVPNGYGHLFFQIIGDSGVGEFY